MSKPILLVDCDDTIENFSEVWIKKLNEIYGTNYSTDDIKSWDISYLFQGTVKDDLIAVIDNEDFWKEVIPLEGAVESLRCLMHFFDVYIVTAGTPTSVHWKGNHVINKYFPFIDKDHIISCKHKQLIKGDYLIDDNFDNILYGDYGGILFTASHNREIDCGAFRVVRVNNWKEAVDYLLEEYYGSR